MKVGILSMQRIDNYGSLLQSYALKRMINRLGHEVGFIDIRPGDRSHAADVSDNSPAIVGKSSDKLDIVFKFKEKLFTKRAFRRFRNDELGMSATVDTEGSQYDAVVIGSDEVFNYSPACSWGFSPQLFGAVGSKLTLSYAASCGYSKVEDVFEDHRQQLEQALANIKSLSVRDENTRRFVSEFGRNDARINLDPVLVYDFSEETSACAEPTRWPANVLLVYGYTNRFRDNAEIEAIRGYAKTHGLITVCVGGWQWWCDRYYCPGPFEVLNLFRSSRAVVTDTFHGTIMAAKYNKPLAVFLRDSNVNKLGDLLERVHIESASVLHPDDLASILDEPTDYTKFNETISFERKAAADYIANNLGKIS